MSERILVTYATRKRSTAEVAVFTFHIMNAGPDERSQRKRKAYLDAVRRLLHPVDEVFFRGIGPDSATDSWLARWLFRRFGGAGEGDCRDWGAIRSWAATTFADQLAGIDSTERASATRQLSCRDGYRSRGVCSLRA